MSNPKFTDPNGFVDPEDPEIVREAKKLLVEPVFYDFTEVLNCPSHILSELAI